MSSHARLEVELEPLPLACRIGVPPGLATDPRLAVGPASEMRCRSTQMVTSGGAMVAVLLVAAHYVGKKYRTIGGDSKIEL